MGDAQAFRAFALRWARHTQQCIVNNRPVREHECDCGLYAEREGLQKQLAERAPIPAGPQRIERECGCAWELIVDGEDAACERVATCEGHPGGCPRPYVWPKIVAYLVEPEREGS